MRHYKEIIVDASGGGKKIYGYLRKNLGFSQTKISSVKFDPEGIFLNGRHVTVNAVLSEGDCLRILSDDSKNRDRHIIPVPMELKILYEDESILAVNKPAGVVCHPSKGHLLDSLAGGVRYYFDETDPFANVHLIGRLDKDTSGVVVIAKNGMTAEMLQKIRRTAAYEKLYVAVAKGIFTEKEGTVRIPMREDRDIKTGILKMVRGEEGKDLLSETSYRVIGETEGFSVLLLNIGTGRTHQIRFTMAELGHPLLGDGLYGQKEGEQGNFEGLLKPETYEAADEEQGIYEIKRTALHAAKVTFLHPETGETVRITAPVPKDLRKYLAGCEQII